LYFGPGSYVVFVEATTAGTTTRGVNWLKLLGSMDHILYMGLTSPLEEETFLRWRMDAGIM
jgi:hypothetical protein